MQEPKNNHYYAVVDIENDFDKDSHETWENPDNVIVAIGVKVCDMYGNEVYRSKEYYSTYTNRNAFFVDVGGYPVEMFVGHNFKHDLKFLTARGAQVLTDGRLIHIEEFIASGVTIWDTQVAEYLISGQLAKFSKLNDLGPEYGGVEKPDKIKAYWDAGVKTSDIPEQELLDYLDHDLDTTDLVFRGQLVAATRANQMPLIQAINECQIGVWMMEQAGLAVDPDFLVKRGRELRGTINDLDQKINLSLPLCVPENIPENAVNTAVDCIAQINTNSTQQLSALLFGGELSFDTHLKTGILYKTGARKGQEKLKKSTVEYRVAPPPGYSMAGFKKATKAGMWSTDSTQLKKHLAKGHPRSELIKLVLEKRKLSKELSTYVESLAEQVARDGLVHPSIHLTSTNTGRQSSSRPNSQNLPGKPSTAKRAFVSRFGEDGTIMGVDFKQLEVVAAAFLSGDPQLCADINMGMDCHAETGKEVYGKAHVMTKEERRDVKIINFQTLYGGSPPGISEALGLPLQMCEDIQNSFYARYPGVKAWQDDNIAIVKRNAFRLNDGRWRSFLELPTGRIFTFEGGQKYARPNQFLDPQVKNYPVQGFATGDIVNIMVGVLARQLLRWWKESPDLKDNVKLINQVHDEVVLDVHNNYVKDVADKVQSLMEYAPQILKEKFGIEFNLPLKVDVEVGPNMLDVVAIDSPDSPWYHLYS